MWWKTLFLREDNSQPPWSSGDGLWLEITSHWLSIKPGTWKNHSLGSCPTSLRKMYSFLTCEIGLRIGWDSNSQWSGASDYKSELLQDRGFIYCWLSYNLVLRINVVLSVQSERWHSYLTLNMNYTISFINILPALGYVNTVTVMLLVKLLAQFAYLFLSKNSEMDILHVTSSAMLKGLLRWQK